MNVRNKIHILYVVNNHLNNLFVLSNKAVGREKNPKLINVRPMCIPEARVVMFKPTAAILQNVVAFSECMNFTHCTVEPKFGSTTQKMLISKKSWDANQFLEPLYK